MHSARDATSSHREEHSQSHVNLDGQEDSQMLRGNTHYAQETLLTSVFLEI